MLNYATLGNIVRHVHLHVVPRYKNKVEFEGIAFVDGRWGQNWSPYDKKFRVPAEVMQKIANKIRENL